MKKYSIEIIVSAQENIAEYIRFIRDEYKSPITTNKHLIGLYQEIESLKSYAESIQVSTRNRVLIYGSNARSIKC